jgi:predicted nucleic acid-binding protein
MVTTRAVLIEIGNALVRARYRESAVQLLAAIEADLDITVVALTDELFARAFRLFVSRPDKEWGMTDCVSFVVMTDRGLSEALTADEHFQQAGFRALLRDGA